MYQGASTLDAFGQAVKEPFVHGSASRDAMLAAWRQASVGTCSHHGETLKHHHLILLPGRTQRLLCS